jgi:hypothetical protein
LRVLPENWDTPSVYSEITTMATSTVPHIERPSTLIVTKKGKEPFWLG